MRNADVSNVEALRNYFLGKDPQLKETMADNSLRLIGIPGSQFVLKAELLNAVKKLSKDIGDITEDLAEESSTREQEDERLSQAISAIEGDMITQEDLQRTLLNYYTISQVDYIISHLETLKLEVVQQLPATGRTDTIYLVPSSSATSENIYDEYIYVNNSWEQIGTTEVDLTNYYTKSEVDAIISQLDSGELVIFDTLDMRDKPSTYLDDYKGKVIFVGEMSIYIADPTGDYSFDTYALPKDNTFYYYDEDDDVWRGINEYTNILYDQTVDKHRTWFSLFGWNSGSSSWSGFSAPYAEWVKLSDFVRINQTTSSDENSLVTAKQVKGYVPIYTAGTNVTINSSNEISATDTTYSNFVGTDGTTAGSAGLVPGPLVADDGKFLKADGTWATPSSGAQYTAGDYIDITNNEISVTGIVSTGGGGTSLTLVEGQYYEAEYPGDEPQLITEANSGYYMVENTTDANKKVAIQFSSAIGDSLYVAFVINTQDEMKYVPDSVTYQNDTGSIYYFEDRAIGTNLEPGEKLIISCQSTNTYPPSAILCNLTNEQTIQYVDGYYADGSVGNTIQIYASQNWRYYVYENTGNAGTFGLEITGDSSDSSLYVITDSNDEILLIANYASPSDGYFGVYLNQGDKVYMNICYPDASTSIKVYAGDPPAVLDNYALKTEIPTNNNQLTNGAGYQTASDINSKFTYGTSDLTPGTSPLAEGNFYFVYE